MIAVSPFEFETIIQILSEHVPVGEVRAFGSRYKWTNKNYSDLDLAIDTGKKMTMMQMSLLKDAFEECDLPFRVDVLDYQSISPEFRAVIDKGFEVIMGGPVFRDRKLA
ncbi:MAG: nucleotidyltransferase family protein [Thermoguttaceae bacterium]